MTPIGSSQLLATDRDVVDFGRSPWRLRSRNPPIGKVATFPLLRLDPTVSGKCIREQILGKRTPQASVSSIATRHSRHWFPIGKVSALPGSKVACQSGSCSIRECHS